MEYAWGFAASRQPFPGDFAAAQRIAPQTVACDGGNTAPGCTCQCHLGPTRAAGNAGSGLFDEVLGSSEPQRLRGPQSRVGSNSSARAARGGSSRTPSAQADPGSAAAPTVALEAASSSCSSAARLPSADSTPVCASCSQRPATSGSLHPASSPVLLSTTTPTTTATTAKTAPPSSPLQQNHTPQSPDHNVRPGGSRFRPASQTQSQPHQKQQHQNHQQQQEQQSQPPSQQRQLAARHLVIPHPYPHSGAPLLPTLPLRDHLRAASRRSQASRGSRPSSTPLVATSTTPADATASLHASSPSLDRERLRTSQSHHAAMAGGDSTFRSQSVSAATSLSSRTVNDLASFSREDDAASTQSRSAPPRKPFVTKTNGRTYLSDPTLPYPLPVDLQELHRQSLRTLLLFQLFGGPVCSPSFAKRPPTRVLDLGCGYGFWSMMCHSYFSRKGHSNISFTGLDIAALGGIAGAPNPGHPPASATATTAAAAATAAATAAAAASATPKERGSLSSASGNWAEQPPDKNMQWTFVQHDMRNIPFPFADGEFDLVMCKELSLVNRLPQFQELIDEFLRLLKPGGVLEAWDCDHPIRMLRPHVPDTPSATTTPKLFDHDPSADPTIVTATNGNETSNGKSNSSNSKKGEQENQVTELGAYHLGNSTPLSGPQNTYLYEYNGWINKYLESQQLLNWPCANIGSYFVQEPLLTGHGSKRLAIPLTEVRWEREVVGGVVTKDGKSYIDTGRLSGRGVKSSATAAAGGNTAASTTDKSGSGGGGDQPNNNNNSSSSNVDGNVTGEKRCRVLGSAQLALRQTALQTVLGFIEAMEPVLRETSGKKQDEWDAWMGKLMKELIEKDGASCGECLEVGAWWGMKTLESP